MSNPNSFNSNPFAEVYEAERRDRLARDRLTGARRKCTSYERLYEDAKPAVAELRARMREPGRAGSANDRARRAAQLHSDLRVAEENLDRLRTQRDAERKHVNHCEEEVKATWAEVKAATTKARENAERRRHRQKEDGQRQRTRQGSYGYGYDQHGRSYHDKPPPRPKQSYQPPPSSKQVRKPTQDVIDKYFHTVDTLLADYATLTAFPTPLAWPCSNLACAETRTTRVLAACPCNIKYLFECTRDLKTERLRFHPDRFSKVPEHVRESFKQMAHEIFVVVDDLYGKKKA